MGKLCTGATWRSQHGPSPAQQGYSTNTHARPTRLGKLLFPAKSKGWAGYKKLGWVVYLGYHFSQDSSLVPYAGWGLHFPMPCPL